AARATPRARLVPARPTRPQRARRPARERGPGRRLTGAAVMVLAVAAALLAAASLRLPSLVSALLAAYLALVGEEGLVTLALSPVHAVRAGWLAAAEAVLAGAAAAAWWARGRPGLPAPAPAVRAAARDPLTLGALALLACVLGYELLLALTVPPNNWDSLTYHLARAAAWAQHGGIEWVANAPSDRLNEYQPLAEQENLFLFAATGTDALYAFPQYVAQLAALVAVYGAARRLGFGVRASAGSACVLATFSLVALEATTAQNDLVAASLVAAAACLALGPAGGEWALAGAAAGLGLGAKLTTALVWPALALLAAARGRRRRRVRRRRHVGLRARRRAHGARARLRRLPAPAHDRAVVPGQPPRGAARALPDARPLVGVRRARRRARSARRRRRRRGGRGRVPRRRRGAAGGARRRRGRPAARRPCARARGGRRLLVRGRHEPQRERGLRGVRAARRGAAARGRPLGPGRVRPRARRPAAARARARAAVVPRPAHARVGVQPVPDPLRARGRRARGAARRALLPRRRRERGSARRRRRGRVRDAARRPYEAVRGAPVAVHAGAGARLDVAAAGAAGARRVRAARAARRLRRGDRRRRRAVVRALGPRPRPARLLPAGARRAAAGLPRRRLLRRRERRRRRAVGRPVRVGRLDRAAARELLAARRRPARRRRLRRLSGARAGERPRRRAVGAGSPRGLPLAAPAPAGVAGVEHVGIGGLGRRPSRDVDAVALHVEVVLSLERVVVVQPVGRADGVGVVEGAGRVGVAAWHGCRGAAGRPLHLAGERRARTQTRD